ncbi:ribonuclease J [uncultured Fusobacterium sp.]|jgi:ribonuclease J|uniref:ribonuclease J n=1 Tax=uncultured Fusobacterium sp. TaxID=159267 RepID=UPI0025EF6AEF|nr:ribonuclease J [uncultured Fusobacterium sp.]MCF2639328.1 ribonuclease J [Fusobacterium varium]
MIRKIKDTETQKKKERSNVTGIKEVKAIKEKIRAIKAGIKELKDDSKKTSKVTTTETKEAKIQKEEKMYVIPLGGLEEVGKNMTVVQYRDEIIIIDSGVTFPDENLLGIDLVIPDFTFLENNKDKVKGLFITHGHEDHIGSIPYLYQKIDKTVPMYGGKLTLALAKSKFENPGFSKELPKMKEVKGRSKVKVGKYFTVEFIKVTHSITDAYALVITTPAGVVFHTGDFKIDLTPVDGEGVDFARLSQIGEQGVDLMLSDSTNSEVEGFTPSERSVGEAFKQEFSKAKGRIIVAAFASHVHRLQQIINTAEEYGRRIAIDGRSLVKVFEIASNLGYLRIPEGMMVSLAEVDSLRDNKVVILCTGTQGEPMAALSRIAKNMHKHIKIKEGDTVIISATPIPGNEKAVSNNINNLLKYDAEVVFKKIAGIHVSGHGSKDEQKLMLNLIRPKYFMPVHGEHKMLKAHKDTAIETGVPKNNIIIAQNGSKVEVTKSAVKIKGKVNAGSTLVDGLGVGDIGNIVLKDRQQLSQDGVVVIVFTLDKETGKIIVGPDIVTRGFVYSKESDDIIKEAIETIKQKLDSMDGNAMKDWTMLKNNTRDIASKYFYNKTKRNPVVLPIIMEV